MDHTDAKNQFCWG